MNVIFRVGNFDFTFVGVRLCVVLKVVRFLVSKNGPVSVHGGLIYVAMSVKTVHGFRAHGRRFRRPKNVDVF